MSERDALVRAIAADLYDDTARLAFADWLDEHGEHDRAEFIRVQVELEPMRDRYEIARAAELHKREAELHLQQLWADFATENVPAGKWGWGCAFYRGFPDLHCTPAKEFVESGAEVRRCSPTVRRVVIHCLNGWGERLAACEALRGLAELELACWYADDDMKALAASPHLAGLQVLVLWLSRRIDGTDDATLCRLAAKAKAWPNLRELVLLDPEGDNEGGIKRIVTSVNRSVKRKIARYERGQDERITLAPIMGSHDSGRLPDGRLAFAYNYEPDPPPVRAMLFTPNGEPIEEVAIPEPEEDATDGSYDGRVPAQTARTV